MKKRIFLFLVLFCMLCFALAITTNAEEGVPEVTDTYYIVASQESELSTQLASEGKKVIGIDELFRGNTSTGEDNYLNNFAENSHIELIFAESISHSLGDYKGLLLNKPITITVRYEGFYHKITNVGRENAFTLKHSQASLRLYGSNGLGSYSVKDNVEVDVSHGKVYVWVFDGNVYAENMKTSTGEEFIYTTDDNSSAEGNITNTYEYVDCYCIGSTAVGLLGKGSAEKIVKMDNCYITGTATIYTIATGTVFKNTTFDKFIMDCWEIANQSCVFENCTIGSIQTSSGRTHLTLIDCKIEPKNISLGSDGGGKCYALVYNSATCESSGILNIYRNGDGSTPVTDDTKYPYSLVEEYAQQSPALGHAYIQGNVNNDYCPKGTCFDVTCSRCEYMGTINWESPKAELIEHSHTNITSIDYARGYFEIGAIIYSCTGNDCTSTDSKETEKALLKWLGYSASQDGQQICVGYDLDQEAIAILSAINSKFEIGVCASVETVIQTNSPLEIDENGNLVKLDKAIKASLNDKSISRIDLIIKGDFANKYMKTPVLMSAYVFDGTALKYAYGTNGSVAEITSITYTSLVNQLA